MSFNLQLAKNATKLSPLRNASMFIWDRHYRRAVGALVVYDVTKEDTFIHAKRWMEELRAAAEPDCVIYLVGN